MDFFSLNNWPVWFICAAMIASAVIDWWKFKVPNWLTFPVIFSGWAFGLLHTLNWHIVPNDGVGGIGSSLAGTFLGFALLIPMYAIGGMGAGDVKMTMGFGSWMGAYYSVNSEPSCMGIIFYAFLTGAVVAGIIAIPMIALRRQYRQNMEHARAIMLDLVTSGSLGMVAAKAKERRPRWHRLPYGVPLCIGFVGFLWWSGFPRPALPEQRQEQNFARPFSAPVVCLVQSPLAGLSTSPYRTQS